MDPGNPSSKNVEKTSGDNTLSPTLSISSEIIIIEKKTMSGSFEINGLSCCHSIMGVQKNYRSGSPQRTCTKSKI